jgi:hypothetical protein
VYSDDLDFVLFRLLLSLFRTKKAVDRRLMGVDGVQNRRHSLRLSSAVKPVHSRTIVKRTCTKQRDRNVKKHDIVPILAHKWRQVENETINEMTTNKHDDDDEDDDDDNYTDLLARHHRRMLEEQKDRK